MQHKYKRALYILVLTLFLGMSIRIITMYHSSHLILSPEVTVVMTCRTPIIIGADVCYPLGHTYRGVYEEWVD